MNTSIKRFAAVVFVATALSGATQAKLDIPAFVTKHNQITNIKQKLASMLEDFRTLAWDSESGAHVKEIFTVAIEPTLVAAKSPENQATLIKYAGLFTTTLACKTLPADRKQVKALGNALVAKLTAMVPAPAKTAPKTEDKKTAAPKAEDKKTAKPGTIRSFMNRIVGQKSVDSDPVDSDQTLGVLKTAQAKKEADEKAEKEAKELFEAKKAVFDTAYTARIVAQIQGHEDAQAKADAFDKARKEFQAAAHKDQQATITAYVNMIEDAYNRAETALGKLKEINKEAAAIKPVEKYWKYSFGFVTTHNSVIQKIAKLMAEIVKIQKDVTEVLKGYTVTPGNVAEVIVNALEAIKTEAQVIADKYPVAVTKTEEKAAVKQPADDVVAPAKAKRSSINALISALPSSF